MKKLKDYSWEEKMEILELAGWAIQCESPFEIVTKDGSFASKEAAYMCVGPIVENYLIEEKERIHDFIKKANKERLDLTLLQGDFEAQIKFCTNPSDYMLLKEHYVDLQEYEKAAQCRYFEKLNLKNMKKKHLIK